MDLLKQELPEHESRQHTETVTLESKSKDMASVLALLPQEREFITEDGLPDSGGTRIQFDETGTAHDYEYGKPIKIGNDVLIASNVVICGGVTIGDGSIIGTGSVVTKDIPAGVIAFGNPCRVHRKITDADSIYLKARRE